MKGANQVDFKKNYWEWRFGTLMLTQILYGNLDANTDTVWGEMIRFFKKSGNRDPG